jgi:hypothetical protein
VSRRFIAVDWPGRATGASELIWTAALGLAEGFSTPSRDVDETAAIEGEIYRVAG